MNKRVDGGIVAISDYFTTDINRLDFVKDILQRYALVMVRDKNNPVHFNFITMEDILSNAADDVDWTDKFVSNK